MSEIAPRHSLAWKVSLAEEEGEECFVVHNCCCITWWPGCAGRSGSRWWNWRALECRATWPFDLVVASTPRRCWRRQSEREKVWWFCYRYVEDGFFGCCSILRTTDHKWCPLDVLCPKKRIQDFFILCMWNTWLIKLKSFSDLMMLLSKTRRLLLIFILKSQLWPEVGVIIRTWIVLKTFNIAVQWNHKYVVGGYAYCFTHRALFSSQLRPHLMNWS